MNARTPARHRSRASAACLACRKARIRCVTNQPDNACVNCKDNGYECRFDAKDGRKERASAKAVTESLTKRVHQLEELLRATQPLATGTSATSQDSFLDSLGPSSISTLPGNEGFSTAAGRQSSILSMNFATSMPMLDDSATTTEAEAYILVPSPIRFDMSTGRVRYFGPTTNMNVLTHIAPDADDNGAGSNPGSQLRRSASGGVMGRGQPAVHWPICLVVRDLSPDTHDYLMEQYWTCYNSVLHLVHSDAFNHDLDRGGTQFYSLFLHLAMLATGFRFADKSRADVQRLAMAPGGRFGSTLHEKAVALAKLEFDRPGGIPSIQAFGLLADVEFTIGRDESGWLFAGMSLRLVIDVGLHVDPSPLQLTVKEAQIRHMVLWACILHDMYWSLYLGRPTTLKPVDIAPACLSKDFTRLICCRPSGHEKKLTTRIYEHLLQLMDLISPLCDRSTLARPTRTTEAYFKMVALDEDLHGWYDDLPEDLKWPTTRPNMPSSYFLLHTQYHAALILLHRPFVQYRAGVPGAGAGAGGANAANAANCANSADARSSSGNTNFEEDADMEMPTAGNRNRFTSLSRSVCAEHAGHIVSLFQEYRAQFDVSRVFGTGLSHLGTAATTLMGEAVLEMDRAKRGVVIVQLMSLRRSINLMSGNYPPGRHMTRILDQFIDAVRQQQREGTTPPQSSGSNGPHSAGQDIPLDPALTASGSSGADQRRVSFANDINHGSGQSTQNQTLNKTANGRHPSSSAGPDGTLAVPQHQQPQMVQQAYARSVAGNKHSATSTLDENSFNDQLQGNLYYQGNQHGYNSNGYADQQYQGNPLYGTTGSNQARKRQRIGNPCTFTPTVPASPTLQGLPFMPSSFLESLDASDLVIFPETTGYSDYGFEWDPADMTPI
ncbi:hypothetical protein SBRCBS47491_001238 [Sporothrix bragantina]|uniref:Zn(2)-C6 fungal-type domain-containing protein n=1 Tax=Sporothrix bragantina TaxID=671064 RepID=A0ABP0AX44_9PEZI